MIASVPVTTPELKAFFAEIKFPLPAQQKSLEYKFIQSIENISDHWRLEYWDRNNDHELTLIFSTKDVTTSPNNLYQSLLILLNKKALALKEQFSDD